MVAVALLFWAKAGAAQSGYPPKPQPDQPSNGVLELSEELINPEHVIPSVGGHERIGLWPYGPRIAISLKNISPEPTTIFRMKIGKAYQLAVLEAEGKPVEITERWRRRGKYRPE